MNGKDEFRKYIGLDTSLWMYFLLSVICILIGGVCYAIDRDILIIIIAVGIAAAFFFRGVRDLSMALDTYEKIKRRGLLEEVVSDFTSAILFLDDKLRIGQKYVFIKGYGKVHSFREIRSIYIAHEIHIKYSVDKLKLGLALDPDVSISDMFMVGDKALVEIVQALCERNTNITIGEKIKKELYG